MPILREETTLFPDTLLDEPTWESPDRRWWVLYTKARQEKSLARELLGHRIPFYLPLVKKRSARRGRRIVSFVPLFSGYVFLYATEQQRITSLTTNRVSRVISIDDPQRLVFDLRQLRRLIASDAPLTVESRLTAGNRVRVKSGPFVGLEGVVLTRRGTTRLLVSIDFLQQGASVEIDDFLLERLD